VDDDMKILGICAYYHDSGAALLINGEIIAAAQEERFTNIKFAGLPTYSISHCLKEARINLLSLDGIIFYDKPLRDSNLLNDTKFPNPNFTPGINIYSQFMPSQLDKENLKAKLKKELIAFCKCKLSELPPVYFIEHNQSQVTSAFFSSPFKRAAVICFNSVGDWATASVWTGRDNQLIPQWNLDFPNSFKMLCSAFTYYTGIKLNSDEFRLRELACQGKPKYANLLLDKLIEPEVNGTFYINTDYLYSVTEFTRKKFHASLQTSSESEVKINQWEMDIAASIQRVIEEIIIRLIRTVYQGLGEDYLCLVGDVAHYYMLNSRVMSENPFRDIWIQPRTDYSRGAALAFWYQSAFMCLA
jgi:carbamoyltransferase